MTSVKDKQCPSQQDSQEALALIDNALENDEYNVTLLLKKVDIYLHLADYANVIAQYQKILEVQPESTGIYYNLGTCYLNNDQPSLALPWFQRFLAITPQHAAALNNVGVCYEKLKQFDMAECIYLEAAKIAPESSDILFSLGCLYYHQGRLADAADYLTRCLKHDATHDKAYNNLALCYISLSQPHLAIQTWCTALKTLHSNTYCIETNLLNYYYQQNRFMDIEQHHKTYQTAQSYLAIAKVYNARKDYTAAEAAFNEARAREPNDPVILEKMAAFLLQQQSYDAAVILLTQVYTNHPSLCYCLVALISALHQCCRWDDVDALIPQLYANINHLDINQPAIFPYETLTFIDDNTVQNKITKHFAEQWICKPLTKTQHKKTSCLRIGYISPDLFTHPVTLLLKPLLKAHDRSQFSVYLYDIQRQYDKETEALISHTDYYRDLTTNDAQYAASVIAADNIDILIDCAGHTARARQDILACQAAPFQAHFLGYPASLQAPYIDYFITSQYCVPPFLSEYFSERLILLPHCASCIDDLPRAYCSYQRAELGLPEDRFIYASFNHLKRLDKRTMSIWSRLLIANPRAVLWLQSRDYALRSLIITAFQRLGVREQIFFTEPFLLSQSWPMCLADVCLDTCSIAGATSSLLHLWAGKPVVCFAGNTPQSRTSSDNLHALQLDMLIADSDEAYFAIAHRLHHDSEFYHAVCKTLVTQKVNAPLFNAKQFAYDYEHALRTAYAQHEFL